MRTRRWVLFLGSLAIVSLAGVLHAAGNWPQFRGGTASCVADGMNLPDTWSTTEHVAWAKEIPGQGWSSPIVWGERVFLTSFVSGENVSAPKTGFYAPDDVKTPTGKFRWTVLCLDAKSGQVLWEKVAHEGAPEHTIHVKSSYAPETMATDGERVYAMFGNVGLFCYDLDGNLLWKKSWGVVPTRMGWGPAASPIVHGGRVYVVNDNEKESFVTALDARSGQELWRTEREEISSWSTPFVWENVQRKELVTIGPTRVRSYDLDGKLLWEFGGMSHLCIPMPVVAGDLLIIDSGYEFGQPRPLVAVRPGAKGDISLEKGQKSSEFIAWWLDGAGSYHASPLVYQGQVYILYSQGMLASFDAATGREVYGKKRLGGSVTASPWAADGKIFCLNEDGDTFVVRAGTTFEVLETNKLDEMCMATPAMIEGSLFIRTLTKLYCLRR